MWRSTTFALILVLSIEAIDCKKARRVDAKVEEMKRKNLGAGFDLDGGKQMVQIKQACKKILAEDFADLPESLRQGLEDVDIDDVKIRCRTLLRSDTQDKLQHMKGQVIENLAKVLKQQGLDPDNEHIRAQLEHEWERVLRQKGGDVKDRDGPFHLGAEDSVFIFEEEEGNLFIFCALIALVVVLMFARRVQRAKNTPTDGVVVPVGDDATDQPPMPRPRILAVLMAGGWQRFSLAAVAVLFGQIASIATGRLFPLAWMSLFALALAVVGLRTGMIKMDSKLLGVQPQLKPASDEAERIKED